MKALANAVFPGKPANPANGGTLNPRHLRRQLHEPRLRHRARREVFGLAAVGTNVIGFSKGQDPDSGPTPPGVVADQHEVDAGGGGGTGNHAADAVLVSDDERVVFPGRGDALEGDDLRSPRGKGPADHAAVSGTNGCRGDRLTAPASDPPARTSAIPSLRKS